MYPSGMKMAFDSGDTVFDGKQPEFGVGTFCRSGQWFVIGETAFFPDGTDGIGKEPACGAEGFRRKNAVDVSDIFFGGGT